MSSALGTGSGRMLERRATHTRLVAAAWSAIAIGLGLFAPKIETALSGAGWQADGSESAQARTLIQRDFGGLSSLALMVVVRSYKHRFGDPAFAEN